MSINIIYKSATIFILTVFVFNSHAAIKNECLELNPNENSLLQETFGDYQAINLYSDSEARVDVEKEDNKKGGSIPQGLSESQVVEGERLIIRKNKRLYHKEKNLSGKNVVAVIIYSRYITKSVTGLNLSNFKIKSTTEREVLNSISPGRESTVPKTLVNLLKDPQMTYDYDKQVFVPMSSVVIKRPLADYIPIRRNSSELHSFNQTLFVFDTPLTWSEDYYIRGYFSMVYKPGADAKDNVVKKLSKDFTKKIDNLVSGSRLDNCLYLVIKK